MYAARRKRASAGVWPEVCTGYRARSTFGLYTEAVYKPRGFGRYAGRFRKTWAENLGQKQILVYKFLVSTPYISANVMIQHHLLIPFLKREPPEDSSPQPKVETESPMGSLCPNYLASLNATVMRTDFLDFAMAHTGVRLYLDKERSLEPIVQAHADTKNLSFHYK